MIRAAIGAILLAAAALACGSGSSPTPTPSASSAPSPSATPTASATVRTTPAATPTPSPAVTPAGSLCTTGQLEAVFLGIYGFAGTVDAKFELRNSSDRICYLAGYVSLSALDTQGDIEVSSSFEAVPSPPIVILPPGSDPIPSADSEISHWASGHGFVDVLWVHCEINDPRPAQWLMTPPG